MNNHELTGRKVPASLLADIPKLVSAYYLFHPNVSDPSQQVIFGTSCHRCSSQENSSKQE